MPKKIEGVGKFYDVAEIMEIFDVSETTVLRNFRSGQLRGRKFYCCQINVKEKSLRT